MQNNNKFTCKHYEKWHKKQNRRTLKFKSHCCIGDIQSKLARDIPVRAAAHNYKKLKQH